MCSPASSTKSVASRTRAMSSATIPMIRHPTPWSDRTAAPVTICAHCAAEAGGSPLGVEPSFDMVYNGEPLIRCPGCRTFVPIEPYVELVGDSPLLDCPACRGARDLSLEYSLN